MARWNYDMKAARDWPDNDKKSPLATNKKCQYLTGEPKQRYFCGEPVQPRSSYCPAHHRACYVTWSRALPAQGKKSAPVSRVLEGVG